MNIENRELLRNAIYWLLYISRSFQLLTAYTLNMKKYALPLLMIFLNNVVFAQTPAESFPYPKSITVEGSAEMEIIPDEIYTTVELKEYEKKGTGKITLEKIKADFLQVCKSIGLADSTISIYSYEGENYYGGRRRRGKEELYSSIKYQIKFSTSTKMDELIAKLDDEATQNFEIVRTSHSKIREYRKQLKIQAVKAAKEKAIYLSEAIDEKIGVAINIIEPAEPAEYNPIVGNTNYGFSQRSYAFDGSDETKPAVDFKKLKLRYSANVVFALK